MDVLEAIRARRTVRAFQPAPVEHAHLAQLIAAAGWAPSPHGRQPWRFAIITRPELKTNLASAMGAEWHAQLAHDGQDAASIERRWQRSHERITSAPALIVPCLYLADLDVYPDPARQANETTMAVQSLGCAIQNMLLAAYALGLGSGWMCAPLFSPAAVRATLDLAPNLHPQALILIGYVAQEPARRPRLPPEELVVAWE